MERPTKRPRLSMAEELEDGLDDVNLHEAREQNDLRLKSIFEGIFEKYGKDFSEVGDEIDLETGEIVVNNGHLNGIEGEDDTGENGSWRLEPDLSASLGREADGTTFSDVTHIDETETGGEEGRGDGASQNSWDDTKPWERISHEAADLADVDVDPEDDDDDDDRSSVDSLLDNALSIQNGPDDPFGWKSADTRNHPAEKANTAFETSTHHPHISNTRPEPVESIWRIPEISGRFSTPTADRARPKPTFKNVIRSASPPGAGSLWALPGKSRRNTDSSKKKEPKSEKKPAPAPATIPTPATAPAKRKFTHSSPIVRDWSFAETPDGSESDDPLQEDCEPSPTKKAMHIRGKRLKMESPTRAEKQCRYCKKSFTNADYDAHVKSIIVSDTPDGLHDITKLEKELGVVGDGTAVKPPAQSMRQTHNMVHGKTTKHGSSKPSSTVDAVDQASTPRSNKRGRVIMTPDEAKLILNMRLIQKKTWKDILDHFPDRNIFNLINWNQYHWAHRSMHPPRLSGPWSRAEKEKLNNLANQKGLTWSGIRNEFPGRSHAEIEIELLRFWASGEGFKTEHSARSKIPAKLESVGGENAVPPQKPSGETHSPVDVAVKQHSPHDLIEIPETPPTVFPSAEKKPEESHDSSDAIQSKKSPAFHILAPPLTG
ncbi:hypothetical protein ASPWEDRAFT_61836 [Aspergillus wentii DTO 134E9]|uniref:Myb-like domain-containing protein n=1 Tax=Aspergillus wentii DTO 134E9 TaxID=1073089 RepID=A0A1L9RB11_ASPWE|nr:uncharacterized protein ASPWEDRAFT_61836 [Aspergillus wentii DTO 134E9]OJJ32063.1 hypothetical protein ASPWEDRAFT_61836 [Aspergillus wentii DTO 134E9]